jgi:nicotinate phosphoribosyltransferase
MQTQTASVEAGAGLALLTDLYQLTMAYGYWKTGMAERKAVFHLGFRRAPFRSGFAIACGLARAVEFLQRLQFTDSDLAYLATLEGNDGRRLLEPAFLNYLRDLRFTCDVDAMPEGTAVFGHEPMLRVRGPIIQGQLLETPLLNFLNFETLIATKAARICLAAKGDPVIEFGLRRAQGIDGALTASRAAFVGGCAGTSNVLAGKIYGIPVRGTHAHSWVMSFDSELEAFRAYASVLPNNCIFLVDTYDSLEGVRHAIEVGRWLREQGHQLVGIRLDSGDLAWLSIEARKLLDAAGFKDAAILASNDLDEQTIASLKEQHAAIHAWGVGTRLVTGHDQCALGGVYKLSAIEGRNGVWEDKLKLSEQSIKISTPGIHQVRRFRNDHGLLADAIYDIRRPPTGEVVIVDPTDPTRRKHIKANTPFEDLLVPVFREGKPVSAVPDIRAAQQRTQAQLSQLHAGIKRFVNPHAYPVGFELSLHNVKTELVLKARGEKS